MREPRVPKAGVTGTIRVVEGDPVGGYLHDLGKVTVPDGVALEPGPLSREEREQMSLHPGFGAALVRGLH